MNRSRFMLWRVVGAWLISAAVGGVYLSSMKRSEGGNRPITGPRIAILQEGPQEWADAVKLGFVAGLEENGRRQGRDVFVVLKSPAGSMSLATLAWQLATEREWAAVYTLGTQASQAYYRAMNEKSAPMIFGAVTDPIGAGFYAKDLIHPRRDLTGSQDLWPYERQFVLIGKLRSQAGTPVKLGMVYSSSEVNTKSALKIIVCIAAKQKIELIERAVEVGENEDAGEKTAKVEAALEYVFKAGANAIYIGPDNLTQANAPTIISAAKGRGIPVFTGDIGIVRKGAVATVGTDYFEVGRINGLQAARILGGIQAWTLRPAVEDKGRLYLNAEALKELKIEPPPEVRKEAENGL